MKIRISYLVLFVLCFCAQLFSQEQKSVHEFHKRQFGFKLLPKQTDEEPGKDIIALKQEGNKALSSSVFGYLPDWEYKTARAYLHYDLLTHIAVFDFACDSLGNISNPMYWPWKDVIDSAHLHGVKIIMTATSFDAKSIHYLISNAAAKNRFFANVKLKLSDYKLDGINIDFEGLKIEDRSPGINNFMLELTNFIHANFPGSEVSFAGPAVNWGGWNFSALAAACDYIFIMGYDFYGSWGTTSGPSSPLSGLSYCIQNTVTRADGGYGTVAASNPEKLLLGVPYYGNHWTTKTELRFSDTISYISSTNFRDNIVDVQKYTRIWESNYGVPWYKYQQNGIWHQIWYDDQESIGLKYNFAVAKKLKGVGMWALGQDGSRNELWQLLRSNFTTDVKADDKQTGEKTPCRYVLYQNYPNPFNPSTTIRFSIPEYEFVSLRVYDILGNEVSSLVSGMLQPGEHSVTFDAVSSSGIYFYRIQAGNYSEIKKMTVLK